MFRNQLNPILVHSQIRCCSSNADRLTNLLKVMKKEPSRVPEEKPITETRTLHFFKSTYQEKMSSNKLWSELEKEELKLIHQKPAKNGFQEMINWTNEGKLWNYPINNEEGLEHMKSERFDEHVFFDDLIEQSPAKQPIRDFMNDAALGLGKNAFMTAERKRSYLQWYNDYFKENKDLVETLVDEDEQLTN